MSQRFIIIISFNCLTQLYTISYLSLIFLSIYYNTRIHKEKHYRSTVPLIFINVQIVCTIIIKYLYNYIIFIWHYNYHLPEAALYDGNSCDHIELLEQFYRMLSCGPMKPQITQNYSIASKKFWHTKAVSSIHFYSNFVIH